MLGSAVAGAQAPRPTDRATAFVDVSVVPMDRERVLERQTVVVRDGRIVAMGPAGSTAVPADAMRIDARGKFLMPGLAEMHAHVVGGQNPNHEQLNRDILFLYIANGITSIRAMLGQPNQLPLREQLRRGEVLGPTMYVSAPSLNGNSAPNPDTAAKLVDFAQSDVDLAIRLGTGAWDGLESILLLTETLVPVCSPGSIGPTSS